jgi:hypothetical protein
LCLRAHKLPRCSPIKTSCLNAGGDCLSRPPASVYHTRDASPEARQSILPLSHCLHQKDGEKLTDSVEVEADDEREILMHGASGRVDLALTVMRDG